jgi:hypothetical protein
MPPLLLFEPQVWMSMEEGVDVLGSKTLKHFFRNTHLQD